MLVCGCLCVWLACLCFCVGEPACMCALLLWYFIYFASQGIWGLYRGILSFNLFFPFFMLKVHACSKSYCIFSWHDLRCILPTPKTQLLRVLLAVFSWQPIYHMHVTGTFFFRKWCFMVVLYGALCYIFIMCPVGLSSSVVGMLSMKWRWNNRIIVKVHCALKCLQLF